MKWLYVLVVVPVLSIGFGATLAGSHNPNSIKSPSGNIHCLAVGISGVTCTTTVPFRTVVLHAGHHARIAAPRRLPSGPILTYGDAWGGDISLPIADYQCASERSAMICTDFGAHGFAISRARADTW